MYSTGSFGRIVVVEGVCFDGGCVECGGWSLVLVMSVVERVAVV